MDGAAGTLCTIQINTCAGTIAKYLKQQPYLEDTLKKVLSFESSLVIFIDISQFQAQKNHQRTILPH